MCTQCAKYWYLDGKACKECSSKNDDGAKFSRHVVALMFFCLSGLSASMMVVLLLCACTKNPAPTREEVELEYEKISEEEARTKDKAQLVEMEKKKQKLRRQTMWVEGLQPGVLDKISSTASLLSRKSFSTARSSRRGSASKEMQNEAEEVQSESKEGSKKAKEVQQTRGQHVSLVVESASASASASASESGPSVPIWLQKSEARDQKEQTGIPLSSTQTKRNSIQTKSQAKTAFGDVTTFAAQEAYAFQATFEQASDNLQQTIANDALRETTISNGTDGVAGGVSDATASATQLVGDTVGEIAPQSAEGLPSVGEVNTGGLADNLADNTQEAAATGGTVAGVGAGAVREAYTVGYDLVGFSQVQGSITLAMPTVEWPNTFSGISAHFRSLSLDFINDWGSLDCNLQTNFCQKTLYIMIAFGVFAAGIPLCGWLLTKLVLQHRPGWKGNKKRLTVLVDRQWRIILVIFTIVHAPLTMRLLKNFNCKQYGDLSVLDVDKGLICDRQEFNVCILTGGFFFCLYTIGIPVLLFYILARYESPWADKRFERLVAEGKMTEGRKVRNATPMGRTREILPKKVRRGLLVLGVGRNSQEDDSLGPCHLLLSRHCDAANDRTADHALLPDVADAPLALLTHVDRHPVVRYAVLHRTHIDLCACRKDVDPDRAELGARGH